MDSPLILFHLQKSGYTIAASWLAKMKQAYLSSSRKAEWLAHRRSEKYLFAKPGASG
ncbi:MAG: hypothetical protein ABFD29_10160 [Anaerolineaceae bacterium]